MAVVWAIAASSGWLGSSRVVSGLKLEIADVKDHHERSIQWYSGELFKYQKKQYAPKFSELDQLPLTKVIPSTVVKIPRIVPVETGDGIRSDHRRAKPANSDGAFNTENHYNSLGIGKSNVGDGGSSAISDIVLMSLASGGSGYDDNHKSYVGPVEVDSCHSSYDSGSSYDGGGSCDSSSSFD